MAGITLNVDVRERTGKGGAREARRNGFVPGVLYGGKLDPVAINLRKNEVLKALNSGKFISQLIEIDHNGEKQKVFAQDIQFHPVSDMPEHIDFYRVDEDQLIKVEVSVHFQNEEESPGLKKGGVLNVVRHAVELLVPAGAIPEFVEANLEGLEIGDNVKISDIPLPEGAAPTITDRDFTIATIAGRGGSVDDEETEVTEEAEAEAEAEGEEEETSEE